mmetsp:Transcript_20561/g.47137  ORF Transcript_20561/g.47137 Transcript_20561/m.47137 type:complete len:216 (-) Transcript_20561:3463-4110(-)
MCSSLSILILLDGLCQDVHGLVTFSGYCQFHCLHLCFLHLSSSRCKHCLHTLSLSLQLLCRQLPQATISCCELRQQPLSLFLIGIWVQGAASLLFQLSCLCGRIGFVVANGLVHGLHGCGCRLSLLQELFRLLLCAFPLLLAMPPPSQVFRVCLSNCTTHRLIQVLHLITEICISATAYGQPLCSKPRCFSIFQCILSQCFRHHFHRFLKLALLL